MPACRRWVVVYMGPCPAPKMFCSYLWPMRRTALVFLEQVSTVHSVYWGGGHSPEVRRKWRRKGGGCGEMSLLFVCRVWDIRQLAVPLALLHGHSQAVRRVCWDPHSPSLLSSSSYDFTVRYVWISIFLTPPPHPPPLPSLQTVGH